LKSVWVDRGLHVPKTCTSCIAKRNALKKSQQAMAMVLEATDDDEDVMVVEEEQQHADGVEAWTKSVRTWQS
jgi:hypothetical protein